MKRLILFALISITNLYAESQDLSLFEKRWFVQNGDTLPYRILYPANFDTAKKYPLVFFYMEVEKGDRITKYNWYTGLNFF